MPTPDQTRTVGIFGATGFIGSALAARLAAKEGWSVVRFSRTPPADDPGWRSARGEPDLRGLEAIVNLAGESIAQRWTEARWKRIRASRVGLTQTMVAAIRALDPADRPAVLANASAAGYYESSGDRELREDLAPAAGRLGVLCRDWEAVAVEAEPLGVRVVRLRTGIVLGEGGEAWERLRKVFRLGLGGRLGSGRQWMPWIHLEDEVRAIEFALEHVEVKGPLNLGAPGPVTNREFTARLASALHRPAVMRVPRLALRIGLGEFAESLLASHRMVPQRLREAGFAFRFPDLEAALAELTA